MFANKKTPWFRRGRLVKPRMGLGPGGITIAAPPPPITVAVTPARPSGDGFTWVEGYWYPVGHHYKWHAGYWTQPPYEGAHWVAPHHDGERYFLVTGTETTVELSTITTRAMITIRDFSTEHGRDHDDHYGNAPWQFRALVHLAI